MHPSWEILTKNSKKCISNKLSNLISYKSDYQPQFPLALLVIISIHFEKSHQVSLCQPFVKLYLHLHAMFLHMTKVNEGQTRMFCIVNMRQLSTICQTCRPQDLTNSRQVQDEIKNCFYSVMIVYCCASKIHFVYANK